MNTNCLSFFRKLLGDQRGQVLVLWAVPGMLALLGMSGLTIDVGHAYVVHAQLQNATDAAALAAAGSVNISGATVNSEANLYSANSGSQNANTYESTGVVATQVCLNMLLPSGETCAGDNNPLNAVKVVQTASVPTFFLRVLGVNSIAMQTKSFASMGGPSNLWNIAIIEDTTGSMATTDTNCPGGAVSEYQCALNSIQTILAQVQPCPGAMTSCTPSQANVRIALFTFPNIITSDLPVANACSGTTYVSPLPYQVYTLPKENATSYVPLTYTKGAGTWSASYEVTYGAADADVNGFVSDYYTSGNTSTGNLNPASSLVMAVGYGGDGGGTGTGSGTTKTSSSSKTGCMPISPGGIDLNSATGTPGPTVLVNHANVGEGITYYASVIYAAQAALTAEHTLYPHANNAIIMLSDGQANTQWFYFPQGTITSTPSPDTLQSSTISSTLGYSTLKTSPNLGAYGAAYLSSPNLEASGTISGVYPDFMDECQQAIVAAQYAANASLNQAGIATRVYAISYGSEQTGCGSGSTDSHNDVTLVATGKNVAFSTVGALTPCMTMENIASDLMYFYSDFNQSGSNVDTNCKSTMNPLSKLSDIGIEVGDSFTNVRLLPNNAS